jgi:hypothetical protein
MGATVAGEAASEVCFTPESRHPTNELACRVPTTDIANSCFGVIGSFPQTITVAHELMLDAPMLRSFVVTTLVLVGFVDRLRVMALTPTYCVSACSRFFRWLRGA